MKRRADLNPPLGKTPGWCSIFDRTRDPALKKLLEGGRELSSEQQVSIYPRMVEKAPEPFSKMYLSSHVQYRMDLRGVTVRDIQTALRSLIDEVTRWQRDPGRYRAEIANLRGSKEIQFTDPKTKLFLAIILVKDGVSIVTAYWKGSFDPPAPGSCVRVAFAPHSDSELFGVRTWVSIFPAFGIGRPLRDPKLQIGEAPRAGEGAAPQREMVPSHLETNIGGFAFNTPEKVTPRTIGTPGDLYGHPFRDWVAPRRTARQREQGGDAKRYYERYYKDNRQEILKDSKRWYDQNKNDSDYKRRVERRQDPAQARKMERLPGGGYRDPADRTRDWRGEKESSSIGYYPDEGRFTKPVGVRFEDPMPPAQTLDLGTAFPATYLLKRHTAALAPEAILRATSPSILKGADPLRAVGPATDGSYAVAGSGGSYRVGVEFLGGYVRVACSCPAWVFSGAEYWAERGGYLLGAARGPLTPPDRADPQGHNRLCKHAVAALRQAIEDRRTRKR